MTSAVCVVATARIVDAITRPQSTFSIMHVSGFIVITPRSMASKAVVKVPYIDTLDVLTKQRYLAKIQIVDGVDPYSAEFKVPYIDTLDVLTQRYLE